MTEEGQRRTRQIDRRHRLLELFLCRTLALSHNEVVDEAWRLEPGVSDALSEQIDRFLERPEYGLLGDPIPRTDGTISKQHVAPITRRHIGSTVVLQSIRNQTAATLQYLADIGMAPDAIVFIKGISEECGVVALETCHGLQAIACDLALQIFVRTPSNED